MWSLRERLEDLLAFAERQIFFIGGAPRSGTTWLQLMLDAHPEISCAGEGLFQQELAVPLDRLTQARAQAIAAKNTRLFARTGGYKEPDPEDADPLMALAVLLALWRQAGGKKARAVGEKTPENVFLFPRLKAQFPEAKFIGIARDPRDVLSSAWHFFAPAPDQHNEEAAKIAFIDKAIPSLDKGARALLALRDNYPDACHIVTYEALVNDPAPHLARLCGFLGVSDAAPLIDSCLAQTSFAGLAQGQTTDRRFFRTGTTGDWRQTLTPEMGDWVMQRLGWMFASFGWKEE